MATVSCFKRKKYIEKSFLCSRLICQFLNVKQYHRTNDYTERTSSISSFYNQSAIEQVARQVTLRYNCCFLKTQHLNTRWNVLYLIRIYQSSQSEKYWVVYISWVYTTLIQLRHCLYLYVSAHYLHVVATDHELISRHA